MLPVCYPALALTASAQEHTYRVPFHDVHGRIVLDAKLDGKPAALLLDTGAAHSFTLSPYRPVVLTLEHDEVSFRTVQSDGRVLGFATPDDFHVQAFVGTDLLKHFHAVRIDYKAHVIEFEK